MSSTLWLAGAIAALLGWVGLEVGVGLWLTAHRATLVALAAIIAIQLATFLGFLGLMKPALRHS